MKSRRDFLKTTAAVGAGLTVLPSFSGFSHVKDSKLRVGLIGVGYRGQGHLSRALQRNDVEVIAICDVQQRMMDMAVARVARTSKPKPQVILDGPYGYRKLIENKDIDAVIISTPWEWHAKMCLDAMNARKYVGCEVIVGTTLEECWELVHTSERTGMPLMMLENVCYRRDVMAVLNMVRQNIFGELIHLQGGYQHNLRGIKFNDGKDPLGPGAEFGEKGFSEA